MPQNWFGATFRSFLWENAACTLGHQSTVRPVALFTSAFLFRKNQTASNLPQSPLKISEVRCFVNVLVFWVSGSSVREHWQSWKGLLTDVQHSIDPRCKLGKKYIRHKQEIHKKSIRNTLEIHKIWDPKCWNDLQTYAQHFIDPVDHVSWTRSI